LGQQLLVDPDDLPDRADAGAYGEEELRALCDAFAAGRFGRTAPYALEAPFSVVIGGRLVRGRIDAVYAEAKERFRFRVVDWKTSRTETADPLQLAIYRLAWAEASSVPVSEVDAVFYYVRTDSVVRPPDLPDRAVLEQLLAGVEEAITLVR
jgi:DNA helicase II / ATP-dependent DNA helicase PcrA